MVDPVSEIVSHGDSALFNCTADGGPSNMFRWIEGNDISVLNELMTDASINVADILDMLDYVVSYDYHLSLTDITGVDDGGIYTCIVMNEAGYDVSSVMLYVLPEITVDPVDLFVEYGDSVNLTCEADSYPTPMYQWEKMNSITSNFEEIAGETDATLLFPSIEHVDYGRYRCVAIALTINETVDSGTGLITGTCPSTCMNSLSKEVCLIWWVIY